MAKKYYTPKKSLNKKIEEVGADCGVDLCLTQTGLEITLSVREPAGHLTTLFKGTDRGRYQLNWVLEGLRAYHKYLDKKGIFREGG